MEIISHQKEAFRKYCFKRLNVKKEFLKLFYEVLKIRAFEENGISHHQTFKLLNNMSLNVAGKQRFSDYESFLLTKIRLDNLARRSKFIGVKPIKYWTSRTFLLSQTKGQLLS